MNTQSSSSSNQRVSGRIHRRLTSRWWLILLLWAGLSVPCAYAIYRLVEPSFVATSALAIEPRMNGLAGAPRDGFVDLRMMEPYIRTQAALITRDRVLDGALSRQDVMALPMIKRSSDPGSDLRKKLTVAVSPGSFLILVSLESPNPSEAATILNAVVAYYMAFHGHPKRDETATVRAGLQTQLEKLRRGFAETEKRLRALLRQGKNSTSDTPRVERASAGGHRQADQAESATIRDGQPERIVEAMISTEVELTQLEARLTVAEAANQSGVELLDRRLQQSFDELNASIALLKAQKGVQGRLVYLLRADSGTENDDDFDASLMRLKLDVLLRREQQVRANLQQLEFEAGEVPPFRAVLVDRAATPKAPTRDDRFKLMAAASIGILLLSLGLFSLLPLKHEHSNPQSADTVVG